MSEQKERKQPPNIEGMFTLKVDNISQGTNEDLLREKFSSFGDVGDVYIPRKRGSTDNRGYAFVRFTTEEDGRRAMEGMAGQEIDGNVIGIQEAKVSAVSSMCCDPKTCITSSPYYSNPVLRILAKPCVRRTALAEATIVATIDAATADATRATATTAATAATTAVTARVTATTEIARETALGTATTADTATATARATAATRATTTATTTAAATAAATTNATTATARARLAAATRQEVAGR